MRLARSACRLDISVHRVKCSWALMPDKMQQRSVTVFRSGMTGNCGKPRARTSCAPLLERARSDIAQHLRRVGCLHDEHPRRRQMESRDVASATDISGSRDECLRLFAEADTGSARAFRAGLPK